MMKLKEFEKWLQYYKSLDDKEKEDVVNVLLDKEKEDTVD
jgi:hypothetical protein